MSPGPSLLSPYFFFLPSLPNLISSVPMPQSMQNNIYSISPSQENLCIFPPELSLLLSLSGSVDCNMIILCLVGNIHLQASMFHVYLSGLHSVWFFPGSIHSSKDFVIFLNCWVILYRVNAPRFPYPFSGWSPLSYKDSISHHLKLTDSPRLPGHHTSRIYLSLPPPTLRTQKSSAFYIGVGGPNSGPHACILLLSHLPSSFLFPMKFLVRFSGKLGR